jgi:HlyD family secretion protein
MTALLSIVVSETDAILKVPNQALRFRPPRTGADSSAPGTAARVWIVGQDGSPVPVAVTLGRSDETSSEVLGGPLTEGEKLIVGLASPQATSGLAIRLGF